MAVQPYIMQVDLEGKPCLVVGGGGIGLHKARVLVASGAKLTVVSSSFRDGFDDVALTERVERKFEEGDIEGMFLVHAATNRADVNERIAGICADKNIWCSVANDTSKGSFGTPAVLDAGGLRVAVSTGGLSPSYGARLRREIVARIPDHVDAYLEFLGKARTRSKESIRESSLRMRFNAYLASVEGERLFESLDADTMETIVSELLMNPESISDSYTPRWD